MNKYPMRASDLWFKHYHTEEELTDEEKEILLQSTREHEEYMEDLNRRSAIWDKYYAKVDRARLLYEEVQKDAMIEVTKELEEYERKGRNNK